VDWGLLAQIISTGLRTLTLGTLPLQPAILKECQQMDKAPSAWGLAKRENIESQQNFRIYSGIFENT